MVNRHLDETGRNRAVPFVSSHTTHSSSAAHLVSPTQHEWYKDPRRAVHVGVIPYILHNNNMRLDFSPTIHGAKAQRSIFYLLQKKQD